MPPKTSSRLPVHLLIVAAVVLLSFESKSKRTAIQVPPCLSCQARQVQLSDLIRFVVLIIDKSIRCSMIGSAERLHVLA